MYQPGGWGILDYDHTRRESRLWQKDPFVWQNFSRIPNPLAWSSGSFITKSWILLICGCKAYSDFFSYDQNSGKTTHNPFTRIKVKNRLICRECQVKNPPIWAARQVSLNNQVPPPLEYQIETHPKNENSDHEREWAELFQVDPGWWNERGSHHSLMFYSVLFSLPDDGNIYGAPISSLVKLRFLSV